MRDLFADCSAGYRYDLQRHGCDGWHHLQLSSAGDGCGGEPQRIFAHCQHYDTGGRRHASPDRAQHAGGDGGQCRPDQSELGGIDGQRRGDGVSCRALSGPWVRDLRADGGDGGEWDHIQRHWAVSKHYL